MRTVLFSVLTILFLILTSSLSLAVNKEVTLAWDQDGVDLAGFKLHYGTTTGSYS